MNRLYGDVGIVVKMADGLVLGISQRQGTMIQCRDGTLVPLVHDRIFFVWVDGPEAAYIESMDTFGLTACMVFDYGEDGYRLSEAMALWRANEQSTLEDRSGPPRPIADAPF